MSNFLSLVLPASQILYMPYYLAEYYLVRSLWLPTLLPLLPRMKENGYSACWWGGSSIYQRVLLFPEGMMFAILMMNSFVPLLDIVIKSMKSNAGKRRVAA